MSSLKKNWYNNFDRQYSVVQTENSFESTHVQMLVDHTHTSQYFDVTRFYCVCARVFVTYTHAIWHFVRRPIFGNSSLVNLIVRFKYLPFSVLKRAWTYSHVFIGRTCATSSISSDITAYLMWTNTPTHTRTHAHAYIREIQLNCKQRVL